jgi:probable F420-dependent oxidoreductase
VRLGTVHSFQDPPGSSIGHARVYEAAFEQVKRSEELGYDWVNLTEHHVTDDGYGPALLPVLAAMAAVTERLSLSTGMLILPLHHPIRVAEEAAVVDLISGGRLALGLAVGYRRLEFEVFDSPYDRRGRRFEESLEVMLRAWTGEPFSYHGETLEVPLVTVRPLPWQRPHPRLWIGGASDPALRRVLRYGSPVCPGATDDTAEIERINGRVAELAETMGREPPTELVLPRLALVADTVEEARRRALPAISEMFERYMAFGGPPRLADALGDWRLLDELVIVGDEALVAERATGYREMGVTDLLLQFAMPTLDPDLAGESMERFASVAAVRETGAR